MEKQCFGVACIEGFRRDVSESASLLVLAPSSNTRERLLAFRKKIERNEPFSTAHFPLFLFNHDGNREVARLGFPPGKFCFFFSARS